MDLESFNNPKIESIVIWIELDQSKVSMLLQ